MDILRKKLAPVSSEAWEEINRQARIVFQNTLTARKFVDIDGPKGPAFAAVSLGRLVIKDSRDKEGINYGIRKVLPLVEVRKPFCLDIWELDNVSRGAEDINLDSMENAARELADFEEKAIYNGFREASIEGLKEKSAFSEEKFPGTADEILQLLGRLSNELHSKAVGGPYTLVLNPEKWTFIHSVSDTYPLVNQIKNLIKGKIILNPHVSESFLVSSRGGDFRLTLGTDISIGYDSADTEKIKLYFTESFTFQVLEPNAVVVLS